MWAENTGKKLSQVMSHLFTDPTWLDFHVALQSRSYIIPAASKGVTAAQGGGLCAESHHFTSLLGAEMEGQKSFQARFPFGVQIMLMGAILQLPSAKPHL